MSIRVNQSHEGGRLEPKLNMVDVLNCKIIDTFVKNVLK